MKCFLTVLLTEKKSLRLLRFQVECLRGQEGLSMQQSAFRKTGECIKLTLLTPNSST